MPPRQQHILVIDSDPASGRELETLLLNWPVEKVMYIHLSVRAAASLFHTQPIDWLFIRINGWDDFQLIAREVPLSPKVVFLSGRNEKCTGHLQFTLDAHLQPPYRLSRIAKIYNRLTELGFQPRSLDIFFVKSRARYFPVRYNDFRQVERMGWTLIIDTKQAQYRITGTLAGFQARLPITLTRAARGLLVNGGYRENYRNFC